MAIVRAAEAPVFELPGFQFNGLTAPSRGAHELCTWRLHVAPGAASDLHKLDHEEVFIVLAGTLTTVVDGHETVLSPGDALSVPAHTLLAVSNPTSTPASAIVCLPVGAQGEFADGRKVGTPAWAQ